MSITVVGSVGLDTVKSPFGRVTKVLGGSASYFACAASIFSPVNLIAAVGRDFPEEFLKLFKKRNISLEGLQITKHKTFSWSGEYDWGMADPKTLSVDLGAFAYFKPKVPLPYRKSKYIFLANIDPRLQKRTLSQLKTHKAQIVACDTMNYWIENRRKELLGLLKHIDFFFINESEARQLTKEPNLLKAAKALLRLGPKIVFLKKGEHGVLMVSNRHLFSAPAYILESIVDPTGAGDTFAGAVMGYLSSSRRCGIETIRKAVIHGLILATFAVEDFSLDSLKKVTASKIKDRIKKFQKLTSF